MTNNLIIKSANKPRLSVKTQTLATILAVAGMVVIPQLFHFVGAVSGLGTALGETFLPMHLPVILVGFLAGPYAGAIAGFFGPLISFALSGMPGKVILPFIMIELCVYGLIAGILRNVKIPSVAKVLIVQFAGRIARAIAVLFAVYALGSQALSISSIWLSILTGLPGILLQLTLFPLIIFWVDKKE